MTNAHRPFTVALKEYNLVLSHHSNMAAEEDTSRAYPVFWYQCRKGLQSSLGSLRALWSPLL